MMGSGQLSLGALFYAFSIENHVPADHLLRGIDRFVDPGDIRHHLAPFYSTTGRPSVDSELMTRIPIVGCAFGIRSERRRCEEVHLSLAYRWFCRLDLTEPVPDLGLARLLWRAFSSLPGPFARRRWGPGSRVMNAVWRGDGTRRRFLRQRFRPAGGIVRVKRTRN